jgi:hypothetical protein
VSTTENSRDETASTSGRISKGGSAAPRAKALSKMLLDTLNRQMRLHPAPPEPPPIQEGAAMWRHVPDGENLITGLEPPGTIHLADCANDEL